jgi:hypothetical protein
VQRFFSGVFAVAMATSSLAADLQYDSPASQAAITKIAEGIRTGKLTQVTAAELVKAYRSNEIAADQKYKNRYLFVQGYIESVSKDISGEINVTLLGAEYTQLIARIDSKVRVVKGVETRKGLASAQDMSVVDAVTPLRRGMKVRLICIGDGAFMSIPQLRKCDHISL